MYLTSTLEMFLKHRKQHITITILEISYLQSLSSLSTKGMVQDFKLASILLQHQ